MGTGKETGGSLTSRTIYGLCDPDTQELRYVGVANDMFGRFRGHLKEAKKGMRHLHKWIRTLTRKGKLPEAFEIESVNVENWQEAERFWISYFRAIGCRLTNAIEGGKGCLGLRHTEEFKRNMRRRMQGNKHLLGYVPSKETREKISKKAMGNQNLLGYVPSEETRRKIGRAHLGNQYAKGQKLSEGTRQRMRDAHARRRMGEV